MLTKMLSKLGRNRNYSKNIILNLPNRYFLMSLMFLMSLQVISAYLGHGWQKFMFQTLFVVSTNSFGHPGPTTRTCTTSTGIQQNKV